MKFIVHVYPLFCCPGLISEAIYKKVEKDLAIPIVSIAYDGTQADKNRILEPYLRISVSFNEETAHAIERLVPVRSKRAGSGCRPAPSNPHSLFLNFLTH